MFQPQQRVYAMPRGRGWTRAAVVAMGEQNKVKTVEVILDDSGERAVCLATNVHNIIPDAYDPSDPDLFRVGDLHVGPLLFCLKDRYEQRREQYSRMGEMILSVNPFEQLALNGVEKRAEYLQSRDCSAQPPHVWQIADKAYKQIVVRGQGNQSVVISGESGSGKTENTKMLMAYLAELSHTRSTNAIQRSVGQRVSERLHCSNPILESFGNARTVRNDNSSRFGKYMKVFFEPTSGVMVGSEMVTYLLEKSRIVFQGEGERNYHVFYEMLAGLSPTEKVQLGNLKAPQNYKCLSMGGTFTRRGVDGADLNDAAEFKVLCGAMDKIGIDSAQRMSIFRVLSAVLHLQEIMFQPDANDKASIVNEDMLEAACQLLQIKAEELRPCFLIKSKTKIMTTLATQSEAVGLRDAFSKGIYLGVFNWLVEQVNLAIAPPPEFQNGKYVGVLDIFGFENFAKNSFEQLCINYANETLQNHYNKFTFQNDAEECIQEGIPCPVVSYPDNKECIEMFDQKSTGLMAILDEQSNFKLGTSETFTQKVWEQWDQKSEHFVKPKSTKADTFGVRHYASEVSYNTEGWISKNSDALKEAAKECIQSSGDPLIKILLDSAETVAAEGGKKRTTVANRFQMQLHALRDELASTDTHFIRCIKPNSKAAPRCVDNEYVGSQLESAGVLQTIALKRQGYPVRRPIEAFARYFYSIAPKDAVLKFRQKQYRDAAQLTLNRYLRVYGWGQPNFAIGHSKVFCKPEVWGGMEKVLLRQNRSRLRRCLPFLSKWAQNFRRRKEIEERRRQEEQKRMQDETAARARTDVAAVGANSGLPPEKGPSFSELANVFPHFDLPIILDVVYNLPTKEQALAALTDMQKQRLELVVPKNIKRIFEELGIRDGIAERLMANGITTHRALFNLSVDEMKGYGLNDKEIAGLTTRLLAQQSERLVNDRLTNQLGTVSVEELLRDVKEIQKVLREKCPMCGVMVPRASLQNHVDKMHGTGDVRPPPPPSNQRPASYSSEPRSQAPSQPPPPMNQLPQAPPGGYGASPAQQQQAVAYPLPTPPVAQPLGGSAPSLHCIVCGRKNVPLQQRKSGMKCDACIGHRSLGLLRDAQGNATNAPVAQPIRSAPPPQPPQQQYAQPQHGYTPPAPQQAPPPRSPPLNPQVDEEKVNRLCAMGFERTKVVKALTQTGGDANQAITVLLA